MTDGAPGDFDDAHAAIGRVIDALRLAGVNESSIAPVLLAQSIFLWRQAGLTDDQIAYEFASGIEIPLGRNRRRSD